MSPRKRRKVEHTEGFQEILTLCWWSEQEEYELIRPLVLFGDSAPERAIETGCAERALYQKIKDFDEDGVASLFATQPAKRRVLPLTIRRMILDLKSEYPPFSTNEISKICYARSGRMPDRHTVQRVLSEEALQLKANRRFESYHETSKKEGRTNIVTLHYAFLDVLFRAVQEYGPPESFVTDSGSIFLANRAQAIYRALGIRKLEIEKGQPWQSYLESGWNVQRRIADYYFEGAENWPELLEEHDRWMADYNVQEHYAHQHRKDRRRSPSAVLSWVKTPRFKDEDLERAFFLTRHTRTVDGLGYLVLQRRRLYAEEGLAGLEVAVWVSEDALTVEYDGEALSRYEVECEPASGVTAVGRLRRVKGHTLFETTIVPSQLRLFDLSEVLGEEGWVKFLKLEEYAPRQARHPDELQQVLFSYGEEAV